MKTINEFIKELNEGKWVECTLDEYRSYKSDVYYLEFSKDGIETELKYFKLAPPKQEFPIIFEDGFYKIQITKNLNLDIESKTGYRNFFTFDDSFNLLIQAVEKLKELRGKHE